ncbi:MAG: OmpA family protein [Gammaproteobacteria bacterium]|nr:MAG: OmpA family protein [Gammaproteobacteria bacterium]
MAHTRVKLLSALVATLISSGVLADNHKFEVQVGVGREFFEESRDDATVGNLGFGYVLNKNWTLEAIASDFNTEDSNTGVDIDGRQYRLDALYNIDTTSLWRPYVAFGVGDQSLKVKGLPNNRDTLVNLGAGLKHSLGGNWEFRSDIRAFNSLDREYTDLAVNAGISYLFGAEPVKAAPVVAAPAPAPKPEVDSDGDGVFDSKDQCPDTPKQYKVDAVGCPMELTETVAVKLAVKFDTAKSIVKEEYVDDIGNLAKFMNQYANTVVTVEGHTDSQGSDAYNEKLSQQRAEAVKQVLITKFGIAADRVTAKGFGESKPVGDNATATGREENRRVVGAVSTDVKKKQVK